MEREYDKLTIQELCDIASRYGIIGARYMSKEELIANIDDLEKNVDKEVEVIGILEKLPDGYGFLRFARSDYVSSPDDVYVSHNLIRKHNLRAGDTIKGNVRKPRDGEKYFALSKISMVNFLDVSMNIERPIFEYLTLVHPREKFKHRRAGRATCAAAFVNSTCECVGNLLKRQSQYRAWISFGGYSICGDPASRC